MALHQISRCLMQGRQATKLRHLSAAGITRHMSDSSKVLVSLDDKTGIATVEMNSPPVNSLSLEMLTQMTIELEKLENEKSCKAFILTSAKPGVFSAGLDIMEMYQPKEERLREFWRTLQEVWMRLYGSGKIAIAGINGHSPAGGCLLSMCCDYRIMAEGKFTIGLNETLLGIVAPFWFKDTMLNTIGQRQTELALQLGMMYSSQQALQLGMVDQLVPIEGVTEAAQQELQKWLAIPPMARQITKMMMRKDTIDRLQARRQEDIDNFVNFITRAPVQKAMGMYLEMLKQKAAKKD